MIDICFVGNSSLDDIKRDGKSTKVYGGSAIYSAFSFRCFSNKSVSIISSVNSELNNQLGKQNIHVLGGTITNMTSFKIDESQNTCIGTNYSKDNFKMGKVIEVEHLHISFRKGVNIEKILDKDKIKYRTLSIDVMIHSIKECIPYITKHIKKIDILFCNQEEYKILKNYVVQIPIKIITSGQKPVILIDNNFCYAFNTIATSRIVSTTGAGDSLIGGFLSEFIDSHNTKKSLSRGISCASEAIKKMGPITKIRFSKQKNSYKLLPSHIIVLGNSCSGKTTFIKSLRSIYDIYENIDDLKPLLEMFLIDDISYNHTKEKFRTIENKLEYMEEIYHSYLTNFNNIEHYTEKSENGHGYNIIKPILWDLILKKALSKSKGRNVIIEFSRGKDPSYEKEFGTDVYKRSIKLILNELHNTENVMIINLRSDLYIRKIRNEKRRKDGGHFVAEKTMNSVYKEDLFNYVHTAKNCGYIIIDSQRYPVYSIKNNTNMNKIELNTFFTDNLNKMLEYYNNFKEK